jgi:hypothetical protein
MKGVASPVLRDRAMRPERRVPESDARDGNRLCRPVERDNRTSVVDCFHGCSE